MDFQNQKKNSYLFNRIIGKFLVLSFVFSSAQAGPWVDQGSMGLRHDIQILADANLIEGPITTWPLSWSDLSRNLEDSKNLNSYELKALKRVRLAANRSMRTERIKLHSRIAVVENPVEIRNFANTPRGDSEIGIGATWTGNRFAYKAQGTWVEDAIDGKEWRADGSYAGVALGNWMLAISMQDRWWGPGWQGSLILSNNARPIPSITFERNSTEAFKSKWMSWIGPWDFSFLLGRTEGRIEPANANFMGMRFNFRPLKNLEIGLSRTAQFCGKVSVFDEDTGDLTGLKKRPCSLSTFWKLLKGQDNSGENVDPNNEPGNQLAGYDGRWSSNLFEQPIALYTQWIGEDNNGLLATSMMGLFGMETWGSLGNLGTYRAYIEWSDTECDFNLYRQGGGTEDLCYNNKTFREKGYRYYDRSIGHTFDNDSSVFSLGGIFIDNKDSIWTAKLNFGNLNRDDESNRPLENIRNTVAKEKTKYAELLIDFTKDTKFGRFRLGTGYDYRKITRTGEKEKDLEFYLEWTLAQL
ncbi:MAG: capsule assembly Wzi family protein [Pseudomonadota bacterium]|nr:capsule assembly Wzi family protein [Pseudomonadota bacterium]